MWLLHKLIQLNLNPWPKTKRSNLVLYLNLCVSYSICLCCAAFFTTIDAAVNQFWWCLHWWSLQMVIGLRSLYNGHFQLTLPVYRSLIANVLRSILNGFPPLLFLYTQHCHSSFLSFCTRGVSFLLVCPKVRSWWAVRSIYKHEKKCVDNRI